MFISLSSNKKLLCKYMYLTMLQSSSFQSTVINEESMTLVTIKWAWSDEEFERGGANSNLKDKVRLFNHSYS